MNYVTKYIHLITLSALMLFGCSKPAPVTEAKNLLGTTKEFSSDQTEIVFDLAKKFPAGVQIAISIIDDTLTYHYGVERVGAELTTIQNHNSAFEIGSISKVFTSTLLADEVVAGTLKLTDVVNDAFPFEFKDGVELPYVRLSNHTSGLPRVPPGMMWNSLLNGDNPYKNFTEEKLETYLREKMRARSDTPKYKYSNLAAGLLGYTLSKRANKTYPALLTEKLLRPMGMTQTSANRVDLVDVLVKGRDEYGEIVPNWDLGPLQGAGAIISTSNDLTKFARAQFDTTNTALALTRQKTFMVNENLDIGLGWLILKREGKVLHWHNGGTGGYKSCMIVDVENRKSVIVLSNLSAGSPEAENVDKICFGLAKKL